MSKAKRHSPSYSNGFPASSNAETRAPTSLVKAFCTDGICLWWSFSLSCESKSRCLKLLTKHAISGPAVTHFSNLQDCWLIPQRLHHLSLLHCTVHVHDPELLQRKEFCFVHSNGATTESLETGWMVYPQFREIIQMHWKLACIVCVVKGEEPWQKHSECIGILLKVWSADWTDDLKHTEIKIQNKTPVAKHW